MIVRDLVVSIVVGAILLLSLSKWVGKVRFSIRNAFWGSAIGHTITSIIGLVIGLFFSHQTDDGATTNLNGVAFLVGMAFGCFLQAVMFQVLARTQNEFLARWRAIILSLIVILGDFLVASPLLELWEHLHR